MKDLSSLDTKKYKNVLKSVRVMFFVKTVKEFYATTASLMKLIFYIKNKIQQTLNFTTKQ